MPTRATVLGGAALVALGLGFALVPARGQQIHRHSFAGRQPALVRWDANVRAEEKEHAVTDLSFKSQPASEHLKVVCEAGTGESPFVHYFYDTPPAPITELLSASVWVKATRPGVQLRARVVFPKEADPARPEVALTALIVGKTYEKTRNWEKLTLEDVPSLLGKSLPKIHAKIGRAVNTTDAYIDRLVLNVYTGPGAVDVWVDDLDIGPVRPASDPRPDQAAPGVPGVPAKAGDPPTPAGKGRQSEQRGGQLLVDGKPYFFRAIRYTGTPLHVLRAAGFDSLWLPADTPAELVADAAREGWFVIPSAPPADLAAVTAAPGEAKLDVFRRKFGTSDVLFWDLGGGLTAEQRDRVQAVHAEIRKGDRRRPVGGDLWDGYDVYSRDLDVLGAHRWPLFTSLELPNYRDWLAQRRVLAGGRPVFWTWVQNHLPDWYAANIAARPVGRGENPELAFTDPVGPHPEQVRQLAYISLACGCRGLGFWSDRYLADSHQGRDRLQGMALLNTELDLLTPVLLSAGATGSRTQWLETSHPHVKAAMSTGQLPNGRTVILLLPIWMGPGDQYVPAQGAVSGLKVTVPGVAEGQHPWVVTPAGVECIQQNATRTAQGTQLRIDEFDMVTPVVFTDDQTPTGLVVWWQDHARRYGRLSARWALDLARAEYEKVRTVHLKLAGMGVEVRGADDLLRETHRYYDAAQAHFANEVYDRAYKDATRALRPLRVLMRDHWRLATEGLDVPTASPFAVSYYSLPQHWELAREVQTCRPAPTLLPYGGFEFPADIPAAGIPIERLAGWSARTSSLDADQAVVAAGVVRSDGLAVERAPRPAVKLPKTMFSPSRPIARPDEGYTPPAPELGTGVLKLEVRSKVQTGRNGKPVEYVAPLERTFLAVDSPPVRLPPGTLVRVSGWVLVPKDVVGTADGALFYDDAGGEPLAVRLLNTREGGEAVWKEFHLYRRVPATGQISVTLALTGLGVAYFDDVRIEPMIAGAATGDTAGATPPGATTAGRTRTRGPVVPASGTGRRGPVVPAGYRPR